ncbi:SEC-C metal-binding domain-containing protein [Paenibacillus sp. N1-5-1-14]|uniref:SEC-C metal-binding domain-containing protein n=1 Tax=Paenibacillus radicibacter TaxID=2972488 RepID=UPI002158E771|nr:SEC-C metal-binding domain-containing protein [Paenibacillus radicibacter]MCR8644672.1 SEC-C metal-binding domain-containing protein [Paenibacillus radicibacter]
MVIHRVSRNDPCPCGSKKKYKRCCLENDQIHNIIPTVAFMPEKSGPTKFTEMTVQDLIESQLKWRQPLYRTTADYLLKQMTGVYDWKYITEAIFLWHAYVSDTEPVIRKEGAFAAAIEYYIAQEYTHNQITQSYLADKYDVSSSTISQRFQQLIEYMEVMNYGSRNEVEANNPLARLHITEQDLMQVQQLFESSSNPVASKMKTASFIDRLMNESAASLAPKSTNKEEAQSLLYVAWSESSKETRIELAKKALSLYPNSADAYTILAEAASKSEEALELYQQGMQVAEQEMDAASFETYKGNFWGMVSTRPYMRAKLGYSQMCHQLGRMRDAIAQYEHMLALNTNDNQGVRYSLLTAYLSTKQTYKAEQLLQQYKEDNCANMNFNRMLIYFERQGTTRQLTSLWKEANKQNPHVTAYLTGDKKLPRKTPEFIGYGDENEAIFYAQGHVHLWNLHTDLIKWLKRKLK